MGSNGRKLSSADPLKSWARRLVRLARDGNGGELDAMALVGLIVDRPAADPPPELWVRPTDAVDFIGIDGIGGPPGGWDDPWLPGVVHEQAVSAMVRQKRGAWYTPPPLVRGLVALVADVVDMPTFAVDPTCGGGAFLLAVLDHWVDAGVDPADALTRVAGLDIDPDAVSVCRLALWMWARKHGVSTDGDDLARRVTVADALSTDSAPHWPERRLVIGNPPFATPLKTSRQTIPKVAEAYRAAHRSELGQYADLAAIHLHRAVHTSGPGSVVMLITPQSVLSSRDVLGLRSEIGSTSATMAMWAAREAVFDAGVRACAPVIVVGGEQPATVTLASGPTADIVGHVSAGYSHRDRWATYAARSLGAPGLPSSVIKPAGVLGDLCSATAGFRDEYYGLAAAAAEWTGPGPAPNRLITVGSVDPLSTKWGSETVRLGGRRWTKPYVQLDELEPKVRRWVERQSVSKLVVATQSKLIEPVLDPAGQMIPSTPLLSVHAAPDDLAHIAAVLMAPPVVASAWQRWFGSALAVDALKMAAGQLLELPLPGDRPTWDAAAEVIASATEGLTCGLDAGEGWSVAVEVASIMNKAYGAAPEVLDWWIERLPKRNAPVAGQRRR